MVYDITNNWTFENIPNWKASFLQKSMVTNADNFPFMVIGNKLDLEEESRAISSDTAREWCKQNGNLTFIETSAKDNKNVEDAFIKLATQALRRQ